MNPRPPPERQKANNTRDFLSIIFYLSPPLPPSPQTNKTLRACTIYRDHPAFPCCSRKSIEKQHTLSFPPPAPRKKSHNAQTNPTNSPGRCFGFLCPVSDAPDPRSSLEPNDNRDPGIILVPSPCPHASPPAGDAAPGAAAAATAPMSSAAAGSPGRKSATPNGSSEVCSRSGLMDGEFGNVSAGPAPPVVVPAAEPGLLWLRLEEDHLPLESPDDLFMSVTQDEWGGDPRIAVYFVVGYAGTVDLLGFLCQSLLAAVMCLRVYTPEYKFEGLTFYDSLLVVYKRVNT